MKACCPQILRAVFFPLSVKQRDGTAYNKDIVIKDKKIKKCCKSHRKTGMNMIY
jgi:membrane protein insertase Oxa1/YidC/SpoIIIJ